MTEPAVLERARFREVLGGLLVARIPLTARSRLMVPLTIVTGLPLLATAGIALRVAADSACATVISMACRPGAARPDGLNASAELPPHFSNRRAAPAGGRAQAG